MSLLKKAGKMLLKLNIVDICRKKLMRKRIKNLTPTFLTPNCMGGLLFHDLGLRFCSPTVNTMLYQTDFVKFVIGLDDYLSYELEFFNHPEYTFPCAHLGDITIHFTHYKTEEEARSKWLERSKRIDKENIFVTCAERDGLTKEDILKLGNIKVRGLMVFTYNDYPDIPYAVQIKKYKNQGEVGNVLRKTVINGAREYEQYFDFVKWFNEANGGNYDATPYKK